MTSPAEIAELVKALRVKESHYDCEDCWFSCATLCCDERRRSDKCDCGADEENALRERAAAALEEVGKDAQRYRWLRFNSDNEFTDREDETPTLIAKGARFSCIGWDEKIDKAIDAAIDTEKNA